MFKPLLASAMLLTVATPAWAGDGTNISTSVTVESNSDRDRIQRYRVSDRTYEVFYYGDRRDSRRDVMDRVLFKAAKKTLDKGYDWFRVVNRETESETERSSRYSARGEFYTVPERHCGLLTCTTRSRTYYRGGIDAGYPSRDDTVYTVVLEIELGEGYVRARDDVYDAKIVKNSYRR